MSAKTYLLAVVLVLCGWHSAQADAIDSLENVLRSNVQVQEKVYIHTDNTCYFIGDTLWYKAYVLRSDDLKPTNLSRLLYVELLSPDGMLVERQHIVISDKGMTCGQFELKDSLYSGYYELRAYTKWDLNFNVGKRKYTFSDKRKFYSKELCDDYFREFEGLYSRVLPVYSKPDTLGDWSQRYMYHRPKQHVFKAKNALQCRFYPEGGSLVDGLRQRVAYELTDNSGQAMDIDGRLTDGTVTRPTHFGRGVFETTPNGKLKNKLTFSCEGKDYTFELPKVESKGAVLKYDPKERMLEIRAKGVTPKAISVTCRGRLAHFQKIYDNRKTATEENRQTPSYYRVSVSNAPLPTGINEIIVYDENAQPLASRLFFVNNNDMAGEIGVKVMDGDSLVDAKSTVNPFRRLGIEVEAAAIDGSFPKTVSVAVRDKRTDDLSYDDGNMLTDMLLSGDLKGFVAYPGYYFASDDEEHTSNLDLLMMVQGWRKYKRIEHARYLPETCLTYEGQVLKLPSTVNTLELSDFNESGLFRNLADDIISSNRFLAEAEGANDRDDENLGVSYEPIEIEGDQGDELHTAEYLKKPVYVEAELVVNGTTAGVVTETDNRGNFRINLPAYYDSGVLFVKAYAKKDSLKKCLTAKKGDKEFLDARAYPDYYVKRDMFFPIFTQPYSWYQVNSPYLVFVDEDDDEQIADNSRLAGNHTLQTVLVRGKRRGKRGIDYMKPAYVRDVYQLYNDVTDYGLSFGVYNAKIFPFQAATFLYGNMGQYRQFNLRATVNESTIFRNYIPDVGEYDRHMTMAKRFDLLQLNRLLNVRAYTDYEQRTDSFVVHERNSAAVTLVFEPMPDDGKRYVYRDRRYIFDGIAYAEEFYNRSYSDDAMPDPKDYRRTLYWNPNAKLDENGRFKDTFYNNSRETRISVSATGVNAEGKIYANQ